MSSPSSSSLSEISQKEEKEIELRDNKEIEERVEGTYKIEEIEEVKKKHPSIFNLIFFRRSFPQIIKGRKGSLNVEDIGQMPSNLNIEKSYDTLLKTWEKETQKKNPSLIRAVIKREWWPFLLSFIAITISQVAMLMFPLMLQFIVAWVKEDEPKKWLGFVYCGIILITQMIDSFGYEFCCKWIFTLSMRVRNGLIGLIFEKALKLNSAGIEDTGKLVNLMSNDAQVLVEGLPSVILGGAAPIMFILVYIALGIIVKIWCLVPLGVMAIFLILNGMFGKGIGIFYDKFVHHKDRRLGFFGEIIRNIKFIKYNSWEESMKKRLNKLRNTELIRLVSFGMFKGALITLMVEIGPTMSFAMFLTMVLTEQEFKIETVYSCMAIFNCIKLPFQSFGYLIACLTTIKVSLTRIKNFLLTPELKPIPVSTKPDSEYAIEMNDVCYKFPDGETAFSCDELKIKKGELVCVLGSVGSGKSSFVLSILNELEKSEGECIINGSVTYGSQTAWLMNTTVRENICFLSPYKKEHYDESTHNACLTRDLQILRGGDMYEVAERGANLSGGQRQRISIARALYNAKDIVIFDDPLSAVDFQVGSFIFEHAIEKQLANKTRIIVTNQTYFIDKADRIIVIEDKKIAFNGSIEALRNSNLEASQFVKTVSAKKKDNNKKEEQKQETTPQDVCETVMEEEHRERGRVAWSVYGKYLRFGGILFFLICMIPFIMRTGALVCYNYFISQWSNGIDDSHLQGDTKWFYAHCYAYASEFILMYITITAMIWFGASASKFLHMDLIKRIFKTKLGFFDVTPLGRIVNYFSRDFHLIDSKIPSQIDQFIGQCCSLLATFIIIFMASYILIPIVVIVIIVFLIFHTFFIKASIEMQRLEGLTRSPIFIHFDQTLLGLATIRTSNGQETFLNALIKKMKNNTLSYYTLQMAKIWYSQRLEWMGFTISTLTVLILVILKCWFNVDTGMASVALMNVTSIPASICIFAQNIVELEITMQSTERVLQLQNIPVEETKEVIQNYQEIPEDWPKEGKIELKGYQFRYREGLPLVLKGVDAVINDKEKIGIVGRTGSGKSTMMAGLFRIEEPAGGSILVDGIDTTTIPMHTLRSRMCILPQEATMFSGTIRENLDPTFQKSDEEMKHVLELVNVNKELDYVVTENGENFSLGERQMICMARALLKGAKILIMDEATASIDIQTDIMIQEMVRKNFKNCTTLTIAHRLHSIMDSNRVMVFDDGHLMEMDTPINLIEQETTIFNNLVQQSGCAEELKRLAKGEASIAETLKAEDEKKKKQENESSDSTEKPTELIDLNTPSASPMPLDGTVTNKDKSPLLNLNTPTVSPLPQHVNDKSESVSEGSDSSSSE
ncbi:hypothetical protein ENUP19_0365G0023 [Entamoeba nuttalli]|uniref:ATP-binding cassette protein n=1 Tax=Entamoeba nuttalli TaxID=412467 RepID=A0ABQ0DYP3_9EUKA